MGLGDDGLSAVLLGKDGGGDELVPLLLLEGIDNLLLASLLGLRESLVLSLLMIESKRERVRCDSCSTYGGAGGSVSSEQAGGPVVRPREGFHVS